MNREEEGFSSPATQEALQSLKSVSVQPSVYFKTRLLARADEQANNSAQSQSYFRLSHALSASLVVCLVSGLIYFGLQNKPDIFAASPTYKTGQSYVIRVDIRPLKDAGISYAEINLSDSNIKFASSEVLEVILQQKLIVAWESIVEKQFLPIVIQGIKPGTSTVVVNFYDFDKKLIKTQNVKLDFKGG